MDKRLEDARRRYSVFCQVVLARRPKGDPMPNEPRVRLRSAESLVAELVAKATDVTREREDALVAFTREVQRNALEAAASVCLTVDWRDDQQYATAVARLIGQCGPRPLTRMTPGPWHRGRGFVFAEAGPSGHDDHDNVQCYGGHLIAESIAEPNLDPISAVPDLIAACKAALWEDSGLACAGQLRVAIAKAEPAQFIADEKERHTP